MTDINLSLPGWPQVVDEPKRKVFTSGDGYRLELDTNNGEIDISVEEVTPAFDIESPDDGK